ncbi:hypothetical protein [Dialister sp.]|uniref:hypothetical protein n=1 Tax=Dialister sp. TaxID=1955814 RepID=UPI003F02E36B
MSENHPHFEIPKDPHKKARYESALKHARAAEAAGKSSEEVHRIFHDVMNFDSSDLDAIPKDPAHQKYRSALIHARKAAEEGKSSEEVHDIFNRVLHGEGKGNCGHKN